MKNVIIVFFVLIVVGCQEQKTPEQLFEECSSGVVVILNEFYYELKLPNGNSVYFTGFDNEGNLENFTPDADEIVKNRQSMTGTGFFIDEKGTIMTNRHVVEPQLDVAKAKTAYVKIIKAIKTLFEYTNSQMEEQYAELERQKNECSYYDLNTNMYYYDTERLQAINNKQQELVNSYNETKKALEELNSLTDLSSLKIEVKCQIGIAYNNSYVTNINDFFGSKECVVTKISEKEDVDLALIRLKNQKTPTEAFVFDINGEQEEEKDVIERVRSFFDKGKDNGELKIDQKLYMIGYNAGLILGNTKQGIKVQMTSGKLTQMPDGQRLLYSIPTMRGSSGSPVIDEKGSLVGVNFAKLSGTDNFNFGIPIDIVRKFYKY